MHISVCVYVYVYMLLYIFIRTYTCVFASKWYVRIVQEQPPRIYIERSAKKKKKHASPKRPNCAAFSSGRVVFMGNKSIHQAFLASHCFHNTITRALKHHVPYTSFKLSNVSTKLQFKKQKINLKSMHSRLCPRTIYEPAVYTGLRYLMPKRKGNGDMTPQIFSTGLLLLCIHTSVVLTRLFRILMCAYLFTCLHV